MDYIVKAVIFGVFLSLVYFVIDYFLDIIKVSIQSLTILPLMCQFGIITAMSVFLSILASAFAFKQILNFLK